MSVHLRPVRSTGLSNSLSRILLASALLVIAALAETAFAGGLAAQSVRTTTFHQTMTTENNLQVEKIQVRKAPTPDKLHIWVKLLNGEMRSVRADQIWRLRLSFSSDEPAGATVLDFAFDRLYISNSVDDIAAQIGGKKRLARFTTPNGRPVYMVASKVIETYKAIRGHHHPAAKAIVGTREGIQQIREPQEKAVEIIESAKSSSS